MRGDFSRIRFNRRKGYTAVLEQQGRVALDADANEQQFIDACRGWAQTVDTVGRYGGPAADAGFQITVPSASDIQIGAGRYYVNGLLCENPASLSYDSQPYLADPANSASSLLGQLDQSATDHVLQVYLEVWQRLVTALDDPCLREPALGQADTTARLQTVWRVVADLVPAPQPQSGQAGPAPSCCQDMYAGPAPQPSTGTMTASTSGPAAECGCAPVPAAGYQGIENQLYRVEIHTGGADSQATFKWSRENGSVVTAITKISGSTVFVSSTGLDANLGFQPGQWVELTDDTLEFGPTPNAPGTLFQILSTSQPTDPDPSVTLVVPANQTISVDPTRNARMRRWDMSGPPVTSAGLPLSPGTPIQLENGIEVTFDPGTFRSGDYWTIPARAATGQIDWPPCGSDGSLAQLPVSVQVHRAPLACIHATAIRVSAGRGHGPVIRHLVDDCRRLFSPLTDLTPAAAIQAAHVTGISWVNDDIMTLDALFANGLTITLDQAPSGNCPLSGANVIVTLELPQSGSFNALSSVTVFAAALTLTGSAIAWRLQLNTDLEAQLVKLLSTGLLVGADAGQWARMRIRLPGRMIYAEGPGGLIYLDGMALGQPGTRQDGVTPRIDLTLPSGAGQVATDFEGWFYLAPILQVGGVYITDPENPPDVTVIVNPLSGQVTGWYVTGTSPEQVVSPGGPQAVIYVNYPVIADTTVTISVLNTDGSQTGVGSIVRIPDTYVIPRGQSSVSVPISIVGNPLVGDSPTTLSFNITASVAVKNGRPSSATTATPLNITGVAPGRRIFTSGTPVELL
jgi:Family of unknown function (DUF6519)